MIFKYDTNKLNDYRKRRIFDVLLMFGLSMLASFPIFYFILKDAEFTLFTIFMVYIILMVFCGGFGIILVYISFKKEFESYQIEYDDQIITIKCKNLSKKINIEKIVKVAKDSKNNIYVYTTRFSKIEIHNFVENINELENILSANNKIEQYNVKYNLFTYIPIFLFSALIVIARIGTIELYLIFAFLVLITLVYSIIQVLLSDLKIVLKFFSIIVNGGLTCVVIIGIIYSIKYLAQ